MLAAINRIFTYLFIAKPKKGKFLKSFGEMEKGLMWIYRDYLERTGEDGGALITEKR